MSLPLLIHDSITAWIYVVVGVFCTLAFYQTTNRYHLRQPALLRFGVLDRLVPFQPKTVWIYFTEYIIFFACGFKLQRWESLTAYFCSYMFILVVSCIVFIVFPVTFPRDDYPLNNYPDNFSKKALHFLRTHMDSPANCLPSLHVSSCFISAFAFWYESTTLFIVFFIWSCLVSYSTMSTKQHYFVDAWTAFLLTLGAFWFFFVHCSYV